MFEQHGIGVYITSPSARSSLRTQGQRTNLRILAAHRARVLHEFSRPEYRGRRECRMPDSTRGPCAEGSKHTVVTTGSPESPGIPCAMVLTGSFVLSPVIGLLPPSSARCASDITYVMRRH